MNQYLSAILMPFALRASGRSTTARLAIDPVGSMRLTTGGGLVGECPSS